MCNYKAGGRGGGVKKKVLVSSTQKMNNIKEKTPIKKRKSASNAFSFVNGNNMHGTKRMVARHATAHTDSRMNVHPDQPSFIRDTQVDCIRYKRHPRR